MEGYKVIEVIKVLIGDILLGVYLNIERADNKLSLHLSISDDGETILITEGNYWVKPIDIKYEVYSVEKVYNSKDGLARLLYNKIENVQYGVGKTLDTNKKVIYYVKINTDKNEFLFFNNGDQGEYSFDKIKEILENDIYSFEWCDTLPVNE